MTDQRRKGKQACQATCAVVILLSRSLRVTPGSLLLGDDGVLGEGCAVLLSNIFSLSFHSECIGPNHFYGKTRSFDLFHLKIGKIFPFVLLSSKYIRGKKFWESQIFTPKNLLHRKVNWVRGTLGGFARATVYLLFPEGTHSGSCGRECCWSGLQPKCFLQTQR